LSEGFFRYVSLKETLFSKLSYDRDGRLMLGSTVVLIVPRRVFSAIQRSMREMLGEGCAALVMYNAGFGLGFEAFGKLSKRFGGDVRGAFEHFITILTTRGWGDFKLEEYDEGSETYRITVRSSYGEDLKPSGRAACHFLRGLLAGALQQAALLRGRDIKLHCVELSCIAKGDECCEFLVLPVEKAAAYYLPPSSSSGVGSVTASSR